ncbi:carbohydrate binding domain-containing protein [Streptosporangium sp. NBC_01495]|uniref:carbohydrate binding domain-containing protein n=1 Tax=Streptosporangium sp. NBC_01495 TaxID=2903899 RepID=UPI002E376A98|nr:carbohydrate binding domain-containing protein [Streptosporangium sp. NBC_01495]
MAEVTPFVEVDFAGTGTWADITPWVRVADRITITRGRGDEQSEVKPATMSLVLDNRDRRFTPLNASSPYYPNVRKGVPIRCSVGAPGFLIANSSFETGTAGWSASGTVLPSVLQQLAWSPGVAGGGTASLRIGWGTGGTSPSVHTSFGNLGPGRAYTASAYVYVSAGSPAVRLEILGLAAGSYSTVTGAWQRITCTFTATSRTHTLSVAPAVSPTSGQIAYVDCVQVDMGGAAAAYGTTTSLVYPRFHGQVNEWPVSFDGGGRLVLSRVTATDTFKRLGGLAPMRSLLEEEMLALEPDAYYTLGESSGSAAGDTAGDGQNELTVFQVAGTGGAVNFGQGTGPGTDGLPAVVFAPASSTDGKGIHANMLAKPTDGNWVLACWITTSTPGREFLQLGYQLYPNGQMATAIGTTAAGLLRVRSYWFSAGTPDGGSTMTGSPNVANGATHFVAIRRRASDSAVFAHVDAAAVGSGFVIPNTAPSNSYDLLSVGGFMHGTVADLFAGTVAHVWYANRNSMPSWTNVWTAGNGSSESTTARFARLCRLLGLTGRVVGTSTAQIAPQTATGKAPEQALRDVAGVEMGLVYAARDDGAVVFECRNHRWDKPPALTLTNEDVLEGSLQWTDDDQLMLNDVTNQREGGAVQRAADPVSIATFGRYTGGQTLPWATDRDAYLNAYYRMINGANPEPRVVAFSVAANTLASYAGVLALDLSDVVRLDNLPSGSPRATDVDVFVEGYSETIEYGLHTITFHTSPGFVFHP